MCRLFCMHLEINDPKMLEGQIYLKLHVWRDVHVSAAVTGRWIPFGWHSQVLFTPLFEDMQVKSQIWMAMWHIDTYSTALSVDYLSSVSLPNWGSMSISAKKVHDQNPKRKLRINPRVLETSTVLPQDFFDQSLDEIKLLRLIRFNTARIPSASAGIVGIGGVPKLRINGLFLRFGKIMKHHPNWFHLLHGSFGSYGELS